MASYSYRLKANESWGKGTVEVGEPSPQGESRVRRLEKTQDRLVSGPMEGINTVHDVLLYACRTFGERKAYGYRDIVDTVEEQKEVTKIIGGEEVKETKTWKYFQLSDYKFISYLEFKSTVSEVARGLVKLDVKKGDVFNIYAQTRQVTHSFPLFSSIFHFPFFHFSISLIPLLGHSMLGGNMHRLHCPTSKSQSGLSAAEVPNLVKRGFIIHMGIPRTALLPLSTMRLPRLFA